MAATFARAARRLEAQSVAQIIEWAREGLGLTYADVARLAGATVRSAQRWGDLNDLTIPAGEHRNRFTQLRDLKRLLEQTFPTENDAVEWVHRPVPLLEGRRPIDVIRIGEIGRVVSVLSGAYSGAFA
jgi:uncharacterized protein (DUF2384 family)